MTFQMLAKNHPMVALCDDDRDDITILEKKIVAKSKYVTSKSDVTRPKYTVSYEPWTLSDTVYRNIRQCIMEQRPSTFQQRKTKKILHMPVLLFLHDDTVTRGTIPFVSRKRGLGVFETKKQRTKFISILSKDCSENVDTVDIAYRGDLLLICPSNHPHKYKFFKTCGVREAMEFDLNTEEIQFSQAYYMFSHKIGETGLFGDRQYDIPPQFDIGPIPDFSMDDDDDVVLASSTDETDGEDDVDPVVQMYTELFKECKRTSTSMYDVDRRYMSTSGDSFISWGQKKLEHLRTTCV